MLKNNNSDTFLEKIKFDLSDVPLEPDHNTERELSAYQIEEIKDSSQNRTERKIYAQKVYRLIVIWLGIIFTILVLQGIKSFYYFTFQLNESVILALIGGTTLNILTLFILIIKYLFKK